MTKAKVLVTGGTGLVGTAISDFVKQNQEFESKYDFVFLSHQDADLSNREETKNLFEIHSPDYVINLAAKVGGLFANMSDDGTFYRLNKAINENVLLCASEMDVNKCISCLSTCIFPADITYPIDETNIHSGPPHSSNFGYSMAKREVDSMNQHYNSVSKRTLFTSIIPTNIYGPNDNFNLVESHVIPGLIHKSYLSAMSAKANKLAQARLEVCGSGKPLRQFIFARDLAELILWTMINYHDGSPLILSPSESDEVSIAHVAETIARLMGEQLGVDISVVFDCSSSDGQLKKTATNRKLKALYPSFRFTPVEQGLRDTIRWFCDNYPNVRK